MSQRPEQTKPAGVSGGSGAALPASLLWALPTHAPDIARIHAMLFPEGWDAAAVERLLANPGSVAMVATMGGPTNVVGFVLAVVAADEAEILSVGVAPEWQRRGIAGRLMGGAKRAAERAGATSLFLEVAPSNRAAQALYGRCGFAETGRRPNYYQRHDGSREDAIIMRSPLASPAR